METTKSPDDLEAVRVISAALAPFPQNEQERIIRWAREKVGLATDTKPPDKVTSLSGEAVPVGASSPGTKHGVTIKHFVDQKKPKSDNQFAAVVAYFHRFEASGAERKDMITADDLLEACRKANRKRLKNPSQTLINAHHGGLLDKGGRGEFTINSVGENLVAMALPESADGGSRPAKRKNRNSQKRAKVKNPRVKK